jgi:hypothetical protein
MCINGTYENEAKETRAISFEEFQKEVGVSGIKCGI